MLITSKRVFIFGLPEIVRPYPFNVYNFTLLFSNDYKTKWFNLIKLIRPIIGIVEVRDSNQTVYDVLLCSMCEVNIVCVR